MVRQLSQSPLSGPDGKQGSVLDGITRLLRNALPGGLARAEHTKKAQATGQAEQRDEPKGAKPEEYR